MIIETDDGGTVNTHDPDRDQRLSVMFFNVTLTVSAPNAQEAYNKLCELLDYGCRRGWLEYETDSYNVSEGHGHETETRSTQELWPK